jgi:hypothetical protein
MEFHSLFASEVYARELAVGGVVHGGWDPVVAESAQRLGASSHAAQPERLTTLPWWNRSVPRLAKLETAGDGGDAPIAAACRYLPLLAVHQTQDRVVPQGWDGLRT